MSKDSSSSNQFQKKTYCKLKKSPLKKAIPSSSLSSFDQKKPKKKIVPSSAMKGLREEFKKAFLPLLIDIFELRQAIKTHKGLRNSPLPIGKVQQSPAAIVARLEELQHEVEESQRWCEGIILQIAKGITEAKELLSFLEMEGSETK